MAIELRRIEVTGDPSAKGANKALVTLVYSDSDDPATATEWIEVRLLSDARFGRVLAEVERDALVRLQTIAADRRMHLESLKDSRL